MSRTTAREHNQLGFSLFQVGAVDLAIEQFQIAVRRAPWMCNYWSNLGTALLDKGRLLEAEEALRRSIEIDPGRQSSHYHLAQLHKAKGDERSMREEYQRVIEIDEYTYLGQRARDHLEDRRPRIVIEE